MRILTPLFLLSALAQLPATTIAAQEMGLAEGARVRLVSSTLPTDHQLARIISASNDTIVFRSDAYPVTRSLALRDIDSIEVSTGNHRRTGRGALIGIGIGIAGGAALGAATFSPCKGFCVVPETRGGAMGAGAAFFGTLGGLTGALIGAMHTQEDWKPLILRPTLAVGAAGQHTFGIQASRTF